ncbi:hypothetical protein CEXT_253421 [Caerostris extrusa]|uniref:Uncharacterized protein n=1 Tax=Caerostris extrusa TaxID=172846 RepID=A0AAV4N2T8_CAEEX|nr:hypothetical protein CEXT_253421 [Caerostris extrusa]
MLVITIKTTTWVSFVHWQSPFLIGGRDILSVLLPRGRGWNGEGVQQLKVLIPSEWKESRSRKENPICQEKPPPHARDAPSWNFLNVRRAERIAT